MIRKLFSGLLGHQWSNCGRRELLEESCRLLFARSRKSPKRDSRNSRLLPEQLRANRINEKAQAAVRILKHNEEYRRGSV